MKIVITSQGNELDSQMDPRFGRAQGFTLLDTETETLSWHDNKQNIMAAHGAGIQAAQNVNRLEAQVIITGHVGPKAFQVLKRSGIQILLAPDGLSVKEAFLKYKEEALEEQMESI